MSNEKDDSISFLKKQENVNEEKKNVTGSHRYPTSGVTCLRGQNPVTEGFNLVKTPVLLD